PKQKPTQPNGRGDGRRLESGNLDRHDDRGERRPQEPDAEQGTEGGRDEVAEELPGGGVVVTTEAFAEDGDQDLRALRREDVRYEQGDGEGREKCVGLGAEAERAEDQGIENQSTHDSQSVQGGG